MRVITYLTTDPDVPPEQRALARIIAFDAPWTMAKWATGPDEATARAKADEWIHAELLKAERREQAAKTKGKPATEDDPGDVV